ncbi:hypothetical protein [Streptomyces sp. NPDC006012]|uniref:hypothetical protein n=1 Tax=Streptomyces sp. NPDC006012 TaxID=3364739 RepID=UPI0036C9094B
MLFSTLAPSGAFALGGPVRAPADEQLTEAQRASQEAKASGQGAEVVGERTEYSQTFANPDGFTFTLEQSVAPMWAQLPDGSFVTPDATLVRQSDGSVRPKAAVVDMTFSGGGDGGGLVRLGKDGRSLSLAWPGKLPTPVLDGDTAVYPEVLPGVDLQMQASTEGFRQVLVVKSREAAENSALARVSFPVGAQGLTVGPGSAGGMRALDGNGNAVFTAPAALMWDSAGDAGSGTRADGAGTGSATPQAGLAGRAGVQGAAAEGGDADPSAGPGAGDASATVPVQVDDQAVSVTPDRDLLTGADTVFPVYIDPQTGLNASARTVVTSTGGKYWAFTGDEGVGDCENKVIGDYLYECGDGSPHVNRMFFQFSPAALAGKNVVDATFRATETWSFSCDATTVDLTRTNNISSATAWPGPSSLGLVASRKVSAGRSTACDPSQPDAPIEFHDSRLTTVVKNFAAGKFARLTLRLSADNESDANGWKRFKNDGVVSVTYVSLPALPSKAGVSGDGGVHSSCEAPEDATVIGDPTPKLTATVKAAAGGEAGAQLRAAFAVERKVNGVWTQVSGGALERPTSGFVGDGQTETVDSPALPDGTDYRVRAWTRSYDQSGNFTSGPDWHCYFSVDSTAPKRMSHVVMR